MADQFDLYQPSYILPARLCPPHKVEALRNALERKLVKLAINAGLATEAKSLVVRDILPNTDLTTPATNSWLTAAMVANTALNIVNAAVLGNKRHIGFYGVFTEAAAPQVANIYFRAGATGGSTYAFYELEALYAEQETIGYFTEPVIYVPNDTMLVTVLPRAAVAGGERFGLIGLICEPKNEIVSGSRELVV